jgi:hypothetical protein
MWCSSTRMSLRLCGVREIITVNAERNDVRRIGSRAFFYRRGIEYEQVKNACLRRRQLDKSRSGFLASGIFARIG